MGRLIDAEKLNFQGQHYNKSQMKAILDFIDAQPTAYDLDKVVEQLEEIKEIMTSGVSEDCFGEECKVSDCTVCLIIKAIEIVKAGGADAKANT